MPNHWLRGLRETLLSLRFQDITHPDDLAADLELLDEVVRGVRQSYEIEKRYRKPSGEYVWTLLSVGLVCSPAGEPSVLHLPGSGGHRPNASAISWNSWRRTTSRRPCSRCLRTPSTSSMSPAASWTSRSIKELLGYTPEEMATFRRGTSQEILPPKDLPALRRGRASLARDRRRGSRTRHQVRHRARRRLALGVQPHDAVPARSRRRGDPATVGVTRDVTEVIAFEERLEHAALTTTSPACTKRRLINRRLGEALDESCGASAQEQREIVVLFCDLDGFKRVNDAHGHQIGDALLRVVQPVGQRHAHRQHGSDGWAATSSWSSWPSPRVRTRPASDGKWRTASSEPWANRWCSIRGTRDHRERRHLRRAARHDPARPVA